MTEIRVGTRESALAINQSEYVIRLLSHHYPEVNFTLVPMKTTGDKILEVSLSKIGEKGLFTKELETALKEGIIDIAVHSLKDLPTELPDGCELVAVTERVDHRDVLVSREGKGLDELPSSARIGTSSLRRRAQLLNYRPDLQLVDIRGNVPTRLSKMEREGLDALVIAAAGLERLSLHHCITQRIPESVCLPAVGQGALGIEGRSGDVEIARMMQAIHHSATGLVTAAERALLYCLGGGCQIPIAALGILEDGVLRLRGLVASPDGNRIIREEGTVDCGFELNDPKARHAAEQLGVKVAEGLLSQGAGALLECAGVEFQK